MDKDLGDLRDLFDDIIGSFEYVDVSEIPNIELYMDQVLTFMDRHLSPYARDPENDKILTKTMINNYTKNHLLEAPVKKKYDIDHMLMLLIIYYMKSFLSISDIRRILTPVREKYIVPFAGQKDKGTGRQRAKSGSFGNTASGPAEGNPDEAAGTAGTQECLLKKGQVTMRDVYEELYQSLVDELGNIIMQTEGQFAASEKSFSDFPQDERLQLQKLDLICRMSAEIYIKKLFIERMLDSGEYE